MPTITQAVIDEFKRVAEWSDEKKLWVYREDRWTGGVASHIIKKKGESMLSLMAQGYYKIRILKKEYRLHRLAYCVYHNTIIDDKIKVDHIDGNIKDNSKENLRLATHAENNRNVVKRKGCSSIYKGVHWCNDNKKWRSVITINRKNRCLGRFGDERDAALAYNAAAIEHRLVFARLNVI